MKRFFIFTGLLAIVIQLAMVEVVSAKLYTWVDRNGVTRRTYYPPPADQVLEEKSGERARAIKKQTQNQVELYVTSWCPYCKQAVDYFRSKGVKFKLYDIEKDREAAARKKKLDRSGGGVPFAIVNGKKISGYAPSQYANALQ